MPSKDPNLGKVKLVRVRGSFLHLYEAQEGKVDEDTGKKGEDKFNGAFLISKTTAEGKATLAAVKAAADAVKKDKWGNNPPKLKPEKICLRDGDLEEYDGYAGHYFLAASNSRQPTLVGPTKDGKGKWVTPDKSSGLLYSGCICTVIVKIWAQDNKHGKRLNASLELVQHVAHAAAFGGARQLSADDELDDDDVNNQTDELEETEDDENDLL